VPPSSKTTLLTCQVTGEAAAGIAELHKEKAVAAATRIKVGVLGVLPVDVSSHSLPGRCAGRTCVGNFVLSYQVAQNGDLRATVKVPAVP
jgi:hypothetical protein